MITVTPGPVTTVTLNRPEVRNAFNETLIQELSDWAASVRADSGIRAVVLQGAGRCSPPAPTCTGWRG